jgi:hypothetical protein
MAHLLYELSSFCASQGAGSSDSRGQHDVVSIEEVWLRHVLLQPRCLWLLIPRLATDWQLQQENRRLNAKLEDALDRYGMG